MWMRTLDSLRHNSCSHTVVAPWRTCHVCTGICYGGRGESFQDIQQAVQPRREKAAENLAKARRAMKEGFGKRRKVATDYHMGDLLLWRDVSTCSEEKGVKRKLPNKYGGCYRIAKVLGNDRYKIKTVGAKGYTEFDATLAVDSLRQRSSAVANTGIG